MRLILASIALISSCLVSTVTDASNNDGHVDDYRQAIIEKCMTDGEGEATCACAFDSWSNALDSKTSPAALAAARMLALPDGQTPNSNDVLKGVRLLQKMSIAISTCADTANAEFSGDAYEQRLDQVDKTEQAINSKKSNHSNTTTSQQVSDLIANMMPKVIGNNAGEKANQDMADLFEAAGRPDLAKVMSDKKIKPDANDIERMQGEQQAKTDKKDKAQREQQANQAEKAKLKARQKRLVKEFSTIDPQTRSVKEYEEVFSVNCLAKGYAKAMCTCNWNIVQATLGGRDDGAARTFTMIAAISSGNLDAVPSNTQKQAFTLHETYGNLQNLKCSRYEN